MLAAVLLLALSCGACAGGTRTPAGGAEPAGPVTVFAAASLTETFRQLAGTFHAAHPRAEVRFNFAGSPTLAGQITKGAPADVFAAASPDTMAQVSEAGDASGQPRVFARNRLEIAVAKGNPKHLSGLADLARPGVKVALCAPQVPCGAAASKVLKAAGVTVTPVTLEQDVKAALTKVALGEVDASLVYRTDVQASRTGVDGVQFPESALAVNDYLIVPLARAVNPRAAEAFVAYVLSDQARGVLTAAGFDTP